MPDDFTINEVAEILHCPPSEVYYRIAKGELPQTRYRNGKHRIRSVDLKRAALANSTADGARNFILKALKTTKGEDVSSSTDFLERLKRATPTERATMAQGLVEGFVTGGFRQTHPHLQGAETAWRREKEAGEKEAREKRAAAGTGRFADVIAEVRKSAARLRATFKASTPPDAADPAGIYEQFQTELAEAIGDYFSLNDAASAKAAKAAVNAIRSTLGDRQ